MFCHEVDINKWKILCVVGIPQKNIDFLSVSRHECVCLYLKAFISISLYILQTINERLENNHFTACASSAVEVVSVNDNVYVSIENVTKGWNTEFEEAEVSTGIFWACGRVAHM